MRDIPYQITAKEFGIRVAKAMDSIRSSHVFFILQQSFPEEADELEWSDFQNILTSVISEEGKNV